MREQVVRVFKQYQPTWEVVTAVDMRTGLEAMWTHRTDLIVLDLCLPDSGPDMSISRIPTMKHAAPVIVLTGVLHEEETEDRCYECGASMVWRKDSLHNGGNAFFVAACDAAMKRNLPTRCAS